MQNNLSFLSKKIEQNIDNATGNRTKCQSTKVNKTIVRWSDPPLDGTVGLIGNCPYYIQRAMSLLIDLNEVSEL